MDWPWLTGVAGELLDGVQGLAPAADQAAQLPAHQLHLIGSVFIHPDDGSGLGPHLGQQAGEKGVDALRLLPLGHGGGGGRGLLPDGGASAALTGSASAGVTSAGVGRSSGSSGAS